MALQVSSQETSLSAGPVASDVGPGPCSASGAPTPQHNGELRGLASEPDSLSTRSKPLDTSS